MKHHRAIFMVLALCASLFAAPNASAVFSKATRLYKAGQYDSTITVIRQFLSTHGKDPGAEYLVPLVMQAMIRANDIGPIESLYDLYIKKFSASAYMPRVHYLYGSVQVKKGAASRALVYYTKALERGASPEVDSLVMAGTVAIFEKTVDTNALRDIIARNDLHRKIRAAAKQCLAERRSEAENSASPKSEKTRKQRDSSNEPRTLAIPASGDFIPLGVLSPLTGEDADVGKKVSQGVQLAVDIYNSAHRPEIRVVSADTRGSLIETAKLMKQIVQSGRIHAIIGPMLSGTATVAASMLMGKPIVMVTPTATDDGIASLAPAVFQTNITLGVLARSIARYAMDNLNIHEFVIVAPRTAYGTVMSNAFREEVAKNGGTIFDEEAFDEGSNNHAELFVNLRHKLLVRKLDRIAKERGIVRQANTLSRSDSLRWADSTIATGGIFIPGATEDVIKIVPQVSFYRIKAQLLGSNGWHSPKTLSGGNQYVQNAVISAPFHPDSTWKPWPAFREAYRSRYHEEPDRLAALGYDAATVVSSALEGSASSSDAAEIAGRLAHVRKFEGASGYLSFDPAKRTNSEAVIYKITPAGFVRIH